MDSQNLNDSMNLIIICRLEYEYVCKVAMNVSQFWFLLLCIPCEKNQQTHAHTNLSILLRLHSSSHDSSVFFFFTLLYVQWIWVYPLSFELNHPIFNELLGMITETCGKLISVNAHSSKQSEEREREKNYLPLISEEAIFDWAERCRKRVNVFFLFS